MSVEFRDFNTKELLEGYRVEVVYPQEGFDSGSINFDPGPLVDVLFGKSGKASGLLKTYLPRNATNYQVSQRDPLLVAQAIHLGFSALMQEVASTDPQRGLKSFDEEHNQINADMAHGTNGVSRKKGE